MDNYDCWSFRRFDLNMEKSHFEGFSRGDFDAYGRVCSDDIVDLLPVDPFGMGITAIKGWPQDFDLDFGSDFENLEVDDSEEETVDDGLLMGMDLVNLKIGAVLISNLIVDKFGVDHVNNNEADVNNNEAVESKSDASNLIHSDKGKELQSEGGDPHDALQHALCYLGVKDLLSVERVCRSLRDAVRGDPLLWKTIHIDQPLSKKITDETLFQLTSRAQGDLQCLSLVKCIRVTDSGLRQVLESNTMLTKLSVPGCVKLTVNGILRNLWDLEAKGTLQIKQLRIGGISRVTQTQFEEFMSLLSANKQMHTGLNKPLFYPAKQLYGPCANDDRPIDIETCPRCLNLKVVYDCPAESCQKKHRSCRACTLCIARCASCGSCIEDREHVETFFLEFFCLDCFEELFNCQDDREASCSSPSSSSGHTIFHQERYQFCVYGT